MKDLKDIEKIMKQQAESMSFDFNDNYWNEMAATMDAAATSNTAAASSIHSGIDAGIVAQSTNQSFDFKDSYWQEMDAMLTESKKKKGLALWMKLGIAATVTLLIGVASIQFLDSTEKINPTITGQNSDFEFVKLPNVSSQTSDLNNESSFENKEITSNNIDDIEQVHIKMMNEVPSKNNDLGKFKLNGSQHHVVQDDISDSQTGQIRKYANDSNSNDPELVVTDKKLEKSNEPIDINIEKLSFLPLRAYGTDLSSVNFSRVKIKNSSLFAHAGMILGNAPEGNVEHRTKIGYGFKGGIGYAYEKANWGLETGVNFIYRAGNNHQYTELTRVYGMKLYEHKEKSIYKSILSLEVPLLATYKIQKHRIGLGVSGVYNVGVNSTLITSNNIDDEEKVMRNNYGVDKGINKFDIKLQLKYEYQISKYFDIGLAGQFGMINQIDTDVMQKTDGFRDLSGVVYLRYNIFRF